MPRNLTQCKILQIINVTRFNILISVTEDIYMYTHTFLYYIHATNPIRMCKSIYAKVGCLSLEASLTTFVCRKDI